MAASDFLQSAIYVIIFLFGGFGLEWLYWSYLSATLKRIELSKPESYGSVLKAAVLRAVLLFGSIAVFAFGSIGLFVGLEWSAFIYDVVLSLLASIIAMRFIIMVAVFVLAPKVDNLRLVPLDKAAAKNVYGWILIISGVGLLGYLCVGTFDRMAMAAPSLLAAESLAGLLFVAVLIGAIWQSDLVRRRGSASTGAGGATAERVLLPAPGNFKLVLSSTFVLIAFILWLLEVDAVFWTLLTLSLLFPAIEFSRVTADHIFDRFENQAPAAAEQDEEAEQAQPSEPSNRYQLYRPIADRLIRFLLVIVAVLTLGMVWDVTSMLQSTSNSLAEKAFGVIIDIVFALLIADFVWTLAKTAIEQKLATFPVVEPGHAPGPEARMATLLPMFKKVLMITIIIMIALIILSSLGVNIGPILAGAGVVGIALGFGAQTLVKDIVSGVFFLIDDAFRVGEYIEMGNLRGTVESVSIRSASSSRRFAYDSLW
jgi:small-conductance mechanosensitive channel